MGILDAPGVSPAQLARTAWASRGLQPVANRSRLAHAVTSSATSQSDGVLTSQTSRTLHTVFADCSELRYVYCNWAYGLPGANDIIVSAAHETGNNAYQVTFAGQTQATIKPDSFVMSDPVGIEHTAAATFFSRTGVSVASGKWPISVRQSGSGDSRVDNDAHASVFTTGALATTTTGVYVYAPSVIVGYPRSGKAPILFFADSIMLGTGDGVTEPTLDPGWAARKLNNTRMFAQLALHGDRASSMTPFTRRNRGRFMGMCPLALCGLGSNDIFAGNRTFAQVSADLVTQWKALQARNVPAVQTTITPRTTSTDSWSTVANQTAVSSSNETTRVTLNAWLRDGAPLDQTTKLQVATGTNPALRAGQAGHPLIGVIELTDLVETARDSGLWAPGTLTGTSTNAGNTITGVVTPADVTLVNGITIAGPGIAAATTISSGAGTGTLTISQNAGAGAGAGTFTVPTASDGIHPGPVGHAKIAANVNFGLFG